MGPCKTGFQKQSLRHVKRSGFHLLQEKVKKLTLICAHCKSPEYHNVFIHMANCKHTEEFFYIVNSLSKNLKEQIWNWNNFPHEEENGVELWRHRNSNSCQAHKCPDYQLYNYCHNSFFFSCFIEPHQGFKNFNAGYPRMLRTNMVSFTCSVFIYCTKEKELQQLTVV